MKKKYVSHFYFNFIYYSSLPDKHITGQFLLKEREEQLKRELVTEEILSKTEKTKEDVSVITKDDDSSKTKVISEPELLLEKHVDVTKSDSSIRINQDKKYSQEEKSTSSTEHKTGDSGEKITITTVIDISEGPSGEEIVRTTVSEKILYPSGNETVSTKVSESIRSHRQKSSVTSLKEVHDPEPLADTRDRNMTSTIAKDLPIESELDKKSVQDDKTTSKTEHRTGDSGEQITITTVTNITKGPHEEEIIKTTITENVVYPSGRETVSTKVSESIKSHKKESSLRKSSEEEEKCTSIDIKQDNVEKAQVTTAKIVQESVGETILDSTDKSILDIAPGGKTITFMETTKLPTESVSQEKEILKDTDALHSTVDGKKESTKVETIIGPVGEEITIETLTETSTMPTGENIIKTTVTETTKYPSGKITISKKYQSK